MNAQRIAGAAVGAALLAAAFAGSAAAQTTRDASERATLLSLIAAVDVAQARDQPDGETFAWGTHILKSTDHTAFVPFRVITPDLLRPSKQLLMYVRAVSRHDGVRSKDEQSFVRDALLKNGAVAPPRRDTLFVGNEELPGGGPAATSARTATQAAADASTRLRLQERMYEREREADDAAKKKKETGERDPYRFPFEDYYSMSSAPAIERALGLPAGEYDVFVALASRTAGRPPAVAHRTLTVPDFWNDQLSLSSVILASDVRTLDAPLARKEQAAHPYTFGRAQVVPVDATSFSRSAVLSIVFQVCNYGAPGTELTADYAFFRVDGERRLFNRTPTQHLSDEDLPRQTNPWETQAFATQAVPLQPFPPGAYELEVTVRDRLTRTSATATTAFVVKP